MPTDRVLCSICHEEFSSKGIGKHKKACEERHKNQTSNKNFREQVRRRENEAFLDDILHPEQRHQQQYETTGSTAQVRVPFNIPDEDSSFRSTSPGLPAEPAYDSEDSAGPKFGDIKRIFHPHSECPESLQSLFEYRSSHILTPSNNPLPVQKPWIPFRTRLDFEVSEFAQQVMLNQKQTNTFISLIRRCAANIEGFTLSNHADMNEQWDATSKKCTAFEKFEVGVPYQDTTVDFEMYARPLWNWTLDLLQDPRLAPFFVWDAEEAYKYNGTKFVRFYTEPWTAAASGSFNPRSPVPKRQSSKGYPIIARLANMVVSIRNSNDWGGGQIVGWLPVIEEDSAQSKKPGYVNFKNAVWHQSFYKLLESIVSHSKTGFWTDCGDGEQRWLFPVVLILASDYEEACTMALIRGLKALYPCPICYIKSDEQSDHKATPILRDSEKSKKIVHQATKLPGEARENLLKDNGLRNVDNVFWNIARTDLHRALSFDRLHAHAGGLWGDHLFSVLKLHASKITRGGAKIDAQFAKFDRWRDLRHFNSVTNQSFNDGSKHEDIGKMMVFAAHNVLTDDLGLKLLKAIRSYVELDIYTSFKLHTSDTIAAGRKALQRFGDMMKEYIAACEGTEFADKNWNFPKMHSHDHVFDDIEDKGVTRNFGTKPDEAMHGAMRDIYLRQTNFRDVAPQILKADHRIMVGKYIRDQLNDLDGLLLVDEDLPEDTEDIVGNVVVGAKRKAIAFSALEQENARDIAFHDFRTRFSHFLSKFLQVYDHGLPDGRLMKLVPEDEIIPFQFLKIFFQSLDDWEDYADYLRCSPDFYGHPRYDAVIIKTVSGTMFARLIFVFGFKIKDKIYRFALIQPLDAGTGPLSPKDKALGFYRVREKPRRDSEFIPVESIIRGALLASDSNKNGEFLVVDVVDSDMFLRLQSMYPQRRRI
ncbi:hypothetical protein C8J57DRAFT_1646956 [Mycena rebaudengoi]|nr:hypothetical protein C8J57DRAFT_1646956 [Mycena rebaudengoi]